MRLAKRISAALKRALPAAVAAVLAAQPVQAQSEIVFAPGTGQATLIMRPLAPPANPRFACSDLATAVARLNAYYPPEPVVLAKLPVAQSAISGIAPPPPPPPAPAVPPAPPQRLDKMLLDEALASYERHVCRWGSGYGPQMLIIVDFARHSAEPRLYALDLATGQGIDNPVVVAHGIGSDPDDDGYADAFGNGQESWMSSLGAARGGELYHGRNGLSLRLDGLDPTNSAMRPRDIVVHSYAPERRRYFNYSLVAARGGKPGASEGCFVVEPHRRDWLFERLRDGGFLYAGLGKGNGDGVRRARLAPVPPATSANPTAAITFAPGTGR